MTQFTPFHQRVIAAIRADAKVGRGTCSVIDEAFTDEELIETFAARGTTRAAVCAARIHHNEWNAAQREVQGA